MKGRTLLAMIVVCGSACSPEVTCTAIAAVSVSVTVTNAEGEGLSESAVTYSIDGGDPQVCESIAESGSLYFCGYEVAGTLTIRVTAEGYEPFQADVAVEADECHVIGQTLDVVLEPVDAG